MVVIFIPSWTSKAWSESLRLRLRLESLRLEAQSRCGTGDESERDHQKLLQKPEISGILRVFKSFSRFLWVILPWFSLMLSRPKPFSTLQVAYRETITEPVELWYTHKKQSGGSGQYVPRPQKSQNTCHTPFWLCVIFGECLCLCEKSGFHYSLLCYSVFFSYQDFFLGWFVFECGIWVNKIHKKKQVPLISSLFL